MSHTPTPPSLLPRRLDPEDAQHALQQVQDILRKQQVIEDLVHRQEAGDAKANLVENLVHRQHVASLKSLIDSLHPSDIAFILASATPFALLRGVGGLTSSSRASSRICCCTRCCWR